jgi:hypothetical protein
MKHLLLILFTTFLTNLSQTQNYQLIATDPMGDGISLENDAENLYYAIDSQNDSLWFKIEVFAPPVDFFCSICIDNDNNVNSGRLFYGNNTAIKCDRTINIYYGAIGFYGEVLDSLQAFTPLPYNVNVIEEDSVFKCNLKLSDILNGNNYDLKVIAMIGQGHVPLPNDDIPDSGFLSIPLGIVGIDQFFYTEILLDVFPNPFENSVTLNYPEKIESILIFNIHGQLIYSQYKTDIDEINLSFLHSGVYLIKVETENGLMIQKKLMKK